MPGFAAQLSPEQIAAVALFERVRFGGQAPDAGLADCGLAAAPEEGSGTTGEGTGTTGGSADTTSGGTTGTSVGTATTAP
jgi:hypothetical protein